MQHLLRWLRNGANPTILSLQALKRDLPDTFAQLVEYLRRAPLYMNVSAGGRDFLLVHSGLGGFSSEKKLSDYEAYLKTLLETGLHRSTRREQHQIVMKSPNLIRRTCHSIRTENAAASDWWMTISLGFDATI